MATMYLFDDVTISLIPSNAAAVAGYVNGTYADMTALKARFPNAHILDIAVSASADATCLDIESGDATNSQAADWVKRQKSRGLAKPVLYTSAGNSQALIDTLASAGIPRSDYVLWSAHYTGSAHICGNDGYPVADGTQFTDTAMGRSLDESEIDEQAFFGANTPSVPPKPTTVKEPSPPKIPSGHQRVPDCRGMDVTSAKNQLENFGLTPEAASDLTGSDVVYETTPAHWSIVLPGSKVTVDAGKTTPEITLNSDQTPWNIALQAALVRAGLDIAVDGVYGPDTDAAVRYFQYEKFGLPGVDGIVGPATWEALTKAGTISLNSNPSERPYPAPGGITLSPWIKRLISWNAVTANGKPVESYTLAVYDVHGKQFASTVVKGTSYEISVPKGTYQIHVWCNGSPVAPPHASLNLTTE